MTLRVRCVRGRVRSQYVVNTLVERRVRSGTAEGFVTETQPPAPVASRGRAGSETAAWFARWAGDRGILTRTPLESKPEQESLLLRGCRSRREPQDQRQVEEGAARRIWQDDPVSAAQPFGPLCPP